jgi:adenylosuccinate synthase
MSQTTWPKGQAALGPVVARAGRSIAVAGLGAGDEGKGASVDALVRRLGVELVVRHNGGPQAAHHVVREDGVVHCFAQFGAGTLVPGVRTHLSRFMLVEPLGLAREAAALGRIGVAAALQRVTIDGACAVVTPFHRLFGRMQELARGSGRHGSCGLGVGAAYVDAHNPRLPTLRFGELLGPVEALRGKLRLIQLVKLDQAEQLAEANPGAGLAPMLGELRRSDLLGDLIAGYRATAQAVTVDDGTALRAVLKDRPESVIFEGAQGVLLDAERGFWPHVTPSRTGFGHAETLLAEAGAPPPLRLGVLRAYATRHGAGPLVSESSELLARLPEPHNPSGQWQGAMRIGCFDLVAARHALALVGGVDGLALTCLDRLAGLGPLTVCTAYRMPMGERLTTLARPQERAAQTALTALLLRCRPELRTLPGWDAPGLSPPAIEHTIGLAAELEVPLLGLAAGPSADARVWTIAAR